jgi:hypothetical protein
VKGLLSWWLICGALALFILSPGRSSPEAFAHPYTHTNGNQTHLHIDADITNGNRPCDPIDETATVAVGSTHEVGVCLETYDPNSVEAFELHIHYGSLNVATEVPDAAPALDDNPDANDGDDPAGFMLGGGWDCTGLGVQMPMGEDPVTAGVTDAIIVCNADIMTPDLDLAADPGLLATVEFTASSPGTDTIDFGPIDGQNKNAVGKPRPGGGLARCGTAVSADEVGCFGATIYKQEAGEPLPTATPTPTGPTLTPGPTSIPTGPLPTLTPVPPDKEPVDLVAGCNPVASTYRDGTPIQTIAGEVGREGNLISIWQLGADGWRGYSALYPEHSELIDVNFLDVMFICVNNSGAFVRPLV